MDRGTLAAFLGQQRWFAGKGRSWQLSDVRTVGALQQGPPRVEVVLATVAYDDGDTETYQLPLVHYPDPVEHLAHALLGPTTAPDGTQVVAYDALHDKDVTGLWLRGMAEEATGEGWAFHKDPSADEVPGVEPSIVVGAEQSNTSVIYGTSVILKCFRKVSPGLNPDIEVHATLAAAGSEYIAPPIGWLEGRWSDDGTDGSPTASLAMAQAFLHNATEGWELAKTSVRDLYAEADLHADEVGGDFASESERLGAATAEVHATLARALPTGELDRKELDALAEAMAGRLERAVVDVPDLAPYVASLRGAFDELAHSADPVQVQRIHGDFHLGQVMRTLEGWKLLDFEGEPARPLVQRRALDSPMKDVAGMLRSFDYAARHLLADHPADPQREYRATEWADRNRESFCRGYADAGGADPRKHAVVLRAFETDKAVYEAVYEARNRPSWLPIPLSAIHRLAATDSDRKGTP
jgi:maltokinase